MADAGQTGSGIATPGDSSPGSALARVSALAGDVRGRYLSMDPGRRRWMGASALLIAALVAGMAWYAGQTDWRVLFSGLDAKDTQQIAQELSAAGIAYQMTDDGSGVEVGADQAEKARMEVATRGMPESGRMGFELFDKPNWVGSEFDEKVNYQRALEGELERTIGTLAVVRSARVHLVLSKDALFGEAEEAAKASVVLQLRRPAMPPEQAEGIRSLVAGAVENLTPDNVTLVDADGRLNLAAPSQGTTGGDLERGMEGRLVAMLEPTAGAGNVRATVTVAYDQGNEEKTDEVYDPTQVVPLSLHKSSQLTGAKLRAAGVPGTASNTAAAVAPGSVPAGAKPGVPPLLKTASDAQKDATLPVYPQGGGDGESTSDETTSFAVSRHLLHTEEGPGRIRRVTAAVVVNDRMTMEGTGKSAHTVWKPRSPEEMQKLEQLAQAAVGFDSSRGDVVVMQNVGFSSNAPEPAAPAMERVMNQTDSLLHAHPGLLRMLCMGALGLLLVLGVLRPMTQQMMKALNQAPPLALAGPSGQGSGGGRDAGMKTIGPRAAVPGLASLLDSTRPTDTQAIYEHISEQIRSEPEQSTRLLQSWMSEPLDEEEN